MTETHPLTQPKLPEVDRLRRSEDADFQSVPSTVFLLPQNDSETTTLTAVDPLNKPINANVTMTEEDPRECGLGKCRPSFLQSWASIKCFTFFCSVLVTVQGILSGGYLPSVISSLERRYDIRSGLSSIIPSSYEFGNLLTVIFVSYLGTRRHIPFWMGVGVIMMAVGSCLFSVPHFLSGPYQGDLIGYAHGNLTDAIQGTICRPAKPSPGPFEAYIEFHQNHHLKKENIFPVCDKSKDKEEPGFGHWHMYLFVLAQILMGSGGSPIFTLGSAYIDDHVKKESSALYLGCMWTMVALGPVVGFLLGGSLLRLHVDFPAIKGENVKLDTTSANWVGAWWGGFVFCGFVLASIAIPFFAFPRSMSREKAKLTLADKEEFNDSFGSLADRSGDAAEDTKEYGKNLKGMPKALGTLFCNPIYFVTCMGACMELVIVSGFCVFLPKYLETQFDVSKADASVLIGGIAMPGACLGILAGGWLLKKLQLQALGASRLLIICNLICLTMFCILFTLGCDNIKIAGATTGYSNSDHVRVEPFLVNLTNPCNMGCGCSEEFLEPICGSDGLTYISPCHAGCRGVAQDAAGIANLQANFSECSCIADGYSQLESSGIVVKPLATTGACPRNCNMLVPFIILTFIMTFTVSVAQMPILMLTMRTVAVEERSLAIGLQFVFFRLLAYIPAPIAVGNLIDTTCLMWKSSDCGSKSGGCLLYDIEKFRHEYIGIGIGFKVAALILFSLVHWLIRQKMQKRDAESEMLSQKKLTIGEILTTSLISLSCAEHGPKCRGTKSCAIRTRLQSFNSLPGDLSSLSSFAKSEAVKSGP